jgi:hypothetical protein
MGVHRGERGEERMPWGLREKTGVAARRTRGSGGATGEVRWGVALAFAASLVTVAAALAAAHFGPGSTYTGRDAYCSSRVSGTNCVFKFRASRDGLSLRFVGETVIDAWGCREGGGEALLGGKATFATPIPLVTVGANGKLYGSISYVLAPTAAPPEHLKVTVTGRLAESGRTAMIVFHQTSASSNANEGCATQPVTLTER